MLKRKRDLGYRSQGGLEIADDELAEVIRASLQEYVAGSHPSPQVWVNIKAELTRLPRPFHLNAHTPLANVLCPRTLWTGVRAFHLRAREFLTPAQAALPRLLQSAVTMALLIFVFSVLLQQPLNPWGRGCGGKVSPAAFSAVQDTLSMAYLVRQRGEVTVNRPLLSTVKRANDPFSSPRFERIRNGVGVLLQEGDDVPLFLPGPEEHLSMVQMAQEAYLSQIEEVRVLEALATPINLDRRLDLGLRP